MKRILIVTLALSGLGFASMSSQPAWASAMNGEYLQNGAIPPNGIALSGAGQEGLSLEGVILAGPAE